MTHLHFFNDAGNYLPMHARSPPPSACASTFAKDREDGPKASRSRTSARSGPTDRLAIDVDLIIARAISSKKTGDLAQDLPISRNSPRSRAELRA
jgi:hypothetical protein